MTPILSEYQNGTKNARVYKTPNGQWGVLVFEAETDYNGFEVFDNEELAEDYAEDWVNGTFPI